MTRCCSRSLRGTISSAVALAAVGADGGSEVSEDDAANDLLAEFAGMGVIAAVGLVV